MATKDSLKVLGQDARGIQNVSAHTSSERFNKYAEGRIDRTYRRRTIGASTHTDPYQNGPTRRRSKMDVREVRRVYDSIRQIMGSDGQLSDEEIDQLQIQKPPAPRFPIIIFSLAVLKDLLDIPATILVVAIPISMLTAFIMNVILFFWMFGKVRFKGIKKFFLLRLIEFIPFVNILPITTIFVLMAHNKEKKWMKLIDLAIEELKRSKLIP